MSDESEGCELARDRSKSTRTKTKRKESQPPTKLIMRRLPPRLTKEDLLDQLPNNLEYNYFNFIEPDWSLGKHAYSRAYINFNNPRDVYEFKNTYDGYTFYDRKNNGCAAVVEFAPFQRIPKIRAGRRKDEKSGTLQSCEMYQQFLEDFKEIVSVNSSSSIESTSSDYWLHKLNTGTIKAKKTSTPLLEFIKQQKLDKQKLRLQKKQLRDQDRKSRYYIRLEDSKGKSKEELTKQDDP